MADTVEQIEEENFQQYYEKWKIKQNQQLQELIVASHQVSSSSNGTVSVDLSVLVKSVVEHYEEYYKAKNKWADKNVLPMLSPEWTTSLEDALLWVGGWRPSMAIHLLYSKSGLQLEAKLGELIQGFFTKHDLGDLSPSQLTRVDELQRRTVNEEKEISEKMAKQQEKAADSDMVELSHLVSEAMREEETIGVGIGGRDREGERNRVESTLSPKEEGFKKILERADNLRLKTFKSIVEILSAIQAVHFLIAAAELQLRLHEWGKAKDERLSTAQQES